MNTENNPANTPNTDHTTPTPASGKGKFTTIAIILVLLLAAVLVGWFFTYQKQNAENAEKLAEVEQLRQLAEMDKAEMENEYANFAAQYNEMKMQINNDSLVAQLEAEQRRSEELLAELQRTKSSDAKEIMRLKKELETLRAILKDFVHQVDSLQRLNEALTNENQNLRNTNQQQQEHISNLNTEREALTEKVNIAAQLDATGVHAQGLNKKGKSEQKIKNVKKLSISFNISRNVTAQAGNRSIYVRITTPTGEVLSRGGSFPYQNRNLEYSIRKDIEYTGEETPITVYWDVAETLSAGSYRADIFADGHNIGSTSFSFK